MLISAMLPPAALSSPSLIDAQSAAPPVAARKPKAVTKFGDRRIDNYFWLREKADPEVTSYLEAENAYLRAVTKPLEGFREKLYKEMLARIKETDESVPYRRRGYWYYQREVEGQQYPIYCRRKGSMDAHEEILVDQNELAKGHKFTSVGILRVSPDGTKLAYSVDFTGFRQYTLRVKDLARGETGPEAIERVTSIAWAADSKTFFYVEEDATTKRPYRLHRHRLGDATDAVVFEEKDELYDLGVGETRSERFIVLGSHAKDTTEMRVLAADDPAGAFKPVAPRRKGHEYYVDHHGDEFFIRTNDKGRNFRLVRAPVADPAPRNWKQVLAHRKLVMLEEVDLFKDFWVAVERDNGMLKLRLFDFATGADHFIAFDEAVYSAHPGTNAEYDTGKFRFVYESLVTPRSWYDYDVRGQTRELLKRQPVLGGYDPSEYASEAITATAKDGTKIPIYLVYRKSSRENRKPQPLLLYGYGSYWFPIDPNFRSTRISLLELA